MKRNSKINKIIRARELRKEQTPAEITLWRYLRNRHLIGKKFRRQYIFRGFIIDFYCTEDKLAIELDGPVHDRQKDQDFARQKLLENYGIKVIRLNNEMILNNINNSLNILRSHFNFPSPSKMERGVSKE